MEILVRYNSAYTLRVKVRGKTTGRNYGYHIPGDEFWIDERDLEKDKRFRVVENSEARDAQYSEEVAPVLQQVSQQTSPKEVSEDAVSAGASNLQDVNGIGPAFSQKLTSNNINNVEELVQESAETLSEKLSISLAKAEEILDNAKRINQLSG